MGKNQGHEKVRHNEMREMSKVYERGKERT